MEKKEHFFRMTALRAMAAVLALSFALYGCGGQPAPPVPGEPSSSEEAGSVPVPGEQEPSASEEAGSVPGSEEILPSASEEAGSVPGPEETLPSTSEAAAAPSPSEPKIWQDARYEAVDETEYTFAASDGRKIFGYRWLPQGAEVPDGGFPVIILSHGYTGRSKSMKADASYFVKRGFACFAFEFCGGNLLELSDGAFEDMTVDTEVDDLHEIWNHVLSHDFVDPDMVFLWGASFGGTVTLLTVVQRGIRPKGAVLEYPAFNMAENAYTGNRGWIGSGEKFLEAAKAYYGKMEDYYRAFDVPALIVHGNRDPLVDLSYSQHAVRFLPDARLEVIDGGAHTFNWEENERTVWPLVFEFLAECCSRGAAAEGD
ncbi:MAG: alpha/beta hydrolase [Lachnospiraceae bacterium]|nr:alpha/beta hydrolase [Lachnospiraceae bacterium]